MFSSSSSERRPPTTCLFIFFFNDTATTEIYTLSLHDALPISYTHLRAHETEVRASAARALAKVQPEISFPVLSTLAADAEWFVRLRAVIAMSSLDHTGKIHVLLRAL